MKKQKFKVDIYRVKESDYDYDRVFCRTEYTEAVSEKQACNNIRHRMKLLYGWKDHDENRGSVAIRYEYVAKIEEQHGYEQLKLFNI